MFVSPGPSDCGIFIVLMLHIVPYFAGKRKGEVLKIKKQK